MREASPVFNFPLLLFVCGWLTNYPYKQAKASWLLGLPGPKEFFGSNVTPWPDCPSLVKKGGGENLPGYFIFQCLTFLIFK